MTATPPSPKITPSSTSATNVKSQTTEARINNLLPSLSSEYSPVSVYTPAAVGGPGAAPNGAFITQSTNPGGGGTWTAPAGVTSVQVECFGGGGGGGGGSAGAVNPPVIGSATIGGSPSGTITAQVNVPAGGSIAVILVSNASGIMPSYTLTDSQNNTYRLITNSTSSNNLQAYVYVASGVTALTEFQDTISVNVALPVPTALSFTALSFPDCPGIDTSFTGVESVGTSTNLSSTATFPQNDSCLVIFGANSSTPSGAASGWSHISSIVANGMATDLYWTQAPTTEALTCSATNSASTGWMGVNLGFTCTSSPVSGGAGGGGGEYSCEPSYPVIPGNTYTYTVGAGGTGGIAGIPGANGGTTQFDLAGTGIAGGVTAFGGTGGDAAGTGTGGAGGTGSANTLTYNGGQGGSNLAGINSDNPVTASPAIQNLRFWYPLNETSNANGTVYNQAPTGSAVNGKLYNTNSASYTQNASSGTAPAQVPTNLWGGATKSGATLRMYQYSSSGSGCNIIPNTTVGMAGGTFSASAWVRSEGSQWNNSGSAAIIMANTVNLASGQTGWSFYLQGSTLYLAIQESSNGATTTVSYNGVSPNNKWYQAGFSFNNGTMTLYVNGVAVASTLSSITHLPSGSENVYIGTDPNGNYQYEGCLSGIWAAQSVVSPAYFAAAYGSVPTAGGSGGGASGGSSNVGNNGGSATGTTGGSAGASGPASVPGTNMGSGAGGAGGNSGASGSSAAAPLLSSALPGAGGGGGAGAGSSAPAITTLSLAVQSSASYCGPDSPTGNAGVMYTTSATPPATDASGVNPLPFVANNTSTVYQGGVNSNSQAAQGTMNSLLLLPPGIAGTLANSTITSVKLTVTCQTSTTTSMMLGYSNDTTLPVNWTGSDISVAAQLAITGTGAQTYDVTNTPLTAALKNGTATALTLGPGTTTSPAAYNSGTASSYYGAFIGADTEANGGMYLTVSYTPAGAVSGGNGATGAIAITYVNPVGTPIASVQPQEVTDSSGNILAAGFTGLIRPFDPTQTTVGNYLPESWKSATLASGWSASSGSNAGTGGFFYRLLSEKLVVISVDVTASSTISAGNSSTLIASGGIQAPYCPYKPMNLSAMAMYGNSTTPNIYLNINPNGAVTVWVRGAGSLAAGSIAGVFLYPLGNLSGIITV